MPDFNSKYLRIGAPVKLWELRWVILAIEGNVASVGRGGQLPQTVLLSTLAPSKLIPGDVVKRIGNNTVTGLVDSAGSAGVRIHWQDGTQTSHKHHECDKLRVMLPKQEGLYELHEY